MTPYETKFGTYQKLITVDESYWAYIPNPLPPSQDFDVKGIHPLLEEATAALKHLDEVCLSLPDINALWDICILKEALMSSKIEGIKPSWEDVLLYGEDEETDNFIEGVKEVACNIEALKHGLKRIKGGFPISSRLLCEVHKILLSNRHGYRLCPGEFRRSQNWIGGPRPSQAVYVPPPPAQVAECMSDLEKFIYKEDAMPALIKAALAHVQFEMIHPFLDGNGRVGRMLINLILNANGLTKSSVLYLSSYFLRYQRQYYAHLEGVQLTGDWEGWIKYFLEGIIQTAEHASETAQDFHNLFEKDVKAIKAAKIRGKSTTAIYEYLKHRPVASLNQIVKGIKSSRQTIINGLRNLERLGIVKKSKVPGLGMVFVYKEHAALLNNL
jgi:Fic family protein